MPLHNPGSTTQRGIVGFLWTFSGSIIQIGSQFLIIAVLARLLTPKEFGIVAIILIIVNFSNLFANFGVATALIQLKDITSNHISQGYSLSIFFGLLIGIIYFFAAPLIATFFGLTSADMALKFFSVFFPLRGFNSVSNALLTRDLKFSYIVKCNSISYIFGIGVTSITLASLGLGYWALIWGQFAGLLITVILMAMKQKPTFSLNYDKIVIKDLLFFGSGHTAGTVFNYFAENSDNIIVGKYLGTIAIGIYSKAFQLFAIPASFFGTIYDQVLFPILSKKQDQKNLLSNFYIFSTSICFGLLFPISTILFINAELIIDLMLGDQWHEVIYPFQILIFGLAYRFGTRINKSYLKSLGIVFRGAYYQLIFAILVLLFCGLGSYFYGLPGAAYGVFFATLLNYLQMSYRLFKELNFCKKDFFLLHLKTILIYGPLYGITILLITLGYKSIWLHLILTIFLYLPLMIYFMFGPFSIVFQIKNHRFITQILKALPLPLRKKLAHISYFNKFLKDT